MKLSEFKLNYEQLKNESKPTWLRNKLARLADNRRDANNRKASNPYYWRRSMSNEVKLRIILAIGVLFLVVGAMTV